LSNANSQTNTGGEKMSKAIIELLEKVVEQAWQEEKAFGKKIFGKEPKNNDRLCQGISRNVFHKIYGCFPFTSMLKFEVNGKSHIIVYTTYDLTDYIIDGTIKQFLPKCKQTVFKRTKYPFNKELQTAERWHT
jgi:hypothetical protein